MGDQADLDALVKRIHQELRAERVAEQQPRPLLFGWISINLWPTGLTRALLWFAGAALILTVLF